MKMVIKIGNGPMRRSLHGNAVGTQRNSRRTAGSVVVGDARAGIRGLAFRNKRLKRAGGCVQTFIVPGLPVIKRNEMMESIKEIA